MKKQISIDEADLALFKNALNDGSGITRQIKQDKIHPTPFASKGKTQQKQQRLKEHQASFYFSDEFIPELPSEGPMRFVREDKSAFLAKQLRRGDFHPEIFLDLHGYTKENAKLDLAALIAQCRKEHIHCCCVIHGIGSRILKQKLPHYLVQHPFVEAFHQAPLEYGGNGALLVLIDIEQQR